MALSVNVTGTITIHHDPFLYVLVVKWSEIHEYINYSNTFITGLAEVQKHKLSIHPTTPTRTHTQSDTHIHVPSYSHL